MKVAVHITINTVGGWDAALEIAGVAQPVRQLAECVEGSARFPLPTEWAAPAEPAKKLRALLRGCHGGGAGAPEIQEFGRYLTAVLFGTQWPAVEAAAADGVVEIELYFPAGDAVFSRLPWDLMHSVAGPLAAHSNLTVSVARIVQSVGTARPLELPLRVLFVVGRQLDEQLRPGAEYYAVLRRTRRDKTTQVQTELLVEATLGEITAAADRLKPHVVHIISHGDDEGRLLLTKEENGRKQTSGVELCDAPKLLGLLSGNGVGLPHVVILNACHTGDVAAGCPSFAAQLVAGGVAYAVGMTGEVADSACRLFTLGFYEALIAKCPSLALAAAAGRRKALLGQHGCKAAVEAARPALCISAAEAATPRLAPTVHPGRQAMLRVPEEFRKTVVCDRFNILHRWQQFAAEAKKPGGPKAFVISVETAETNVKLGKSVMLGEIAALAVGGYFIPCMLDGAGGDRASTPYQFALDVFSAMSKARERFGVPPPTQSSILNAAEKIGLGRPAVLLSPQMTDFDVELGSIRSQLKNCTAATATVIRSVLSNDFKALAADFAAALGGEWTPLAMIDELHKLEGPATMLLEEVFDVAGLGARLPDGGIFPVPMVFTCQKAPGAATERAAHETQVAVAAQDSIRKFVADSTRVTHVALEKFKGSDAEIAVLQYLLSRAENPAVIELGPLTVSPEHQKPEKRHILKTMLKRLTERLDGNPWNFRNGEKFLDYVAYCCDSEVLVPANDEKLIENS